MARNKHPEETVEKILRVSLKLFQEKGYEATTIQDIVDALGMSKGAIYHHFKSKADIMDLLSERYYQNLSWFPDPKGIPGENGLEKLRYVFRYFLSDPSKEEIDGMMLPLLRDPKMVSLSLDSVFREAAPYMDRLVQEAIADGSASPQFPQVLPEAFMLLTNLWMWTELYRRDREGFLQRLLFSKAMLEHFGLPILTSELVEVSMDYYDRLLAQGIPTEQDRP
ncbi:MAG: TetR/AcrR family transcriptional regulator [Flavonifractor sp.]|jgi:AcrR family transcriptional regulator|nr:TetR/AcrR family transcriptional regulator [Flavonifractor sp.]MCI9424722.1 TetR/AcrR family transcriptional regulator [Flavonifractor sp.]MCI9473475.1 TetR/AcrR family transcriptional regulator [Flavonifractor sp.]